MSVASQKSAIHAVLIAVEGAGKYQLEPGQENMGEAAVLAHSLHRKP
jgi:hypothetical protein